MDIPSFLLTEMCQLRRVRPGSTDVWRGGWLARDQVNLYTCRGRGESLTPHQTVIGVFVM